MTRRVKTTIRRKLSGLKHEQNACKRLCCITTSVAQPEPPGCQSRSQSFLACLWQRLKALRGEVKRCITSKSSLRLFGLYDQLVRCTLQELQDAQVKRAEILHERSKCQFSELCQGETESPDRKPNKATAREGMETTEALDISSTCQSEEMVCHSALPECYEKLWETSDRIYSRVSASCGDMHRFLEALWNQHQSRQQQHQSHDQSVDISTFSTRQEDHVPLPTLLRVIEGMLDFVEEVQGEILRARGTISEHVSLQTTGECGVRPTGREQCGANTKWEEDAPEGLYESIDEEYRCNRQLRTQAARR
ncbi:hypothetical protein, conserved (fragment) [Trypanosoma vivax Y486]|uniref:Uncharacterized protein n=1 Tax=Trypanosoma vivax (strain Y486) TaxID=1055687 RepID=F9WV74_TRYVY